jgi:TPR repeat protein
MALPHKQKKLVAIVVSVLSLADCSAETADTNHTGTTAAAIVADDKISQLQREAQKGDPDAQYNLAYRYENGLGVAKDEAKALELYQQAADQGHTAAKALLIQ